MATVAIALPSEISSRALTSESELSTSEALALRNFWEIPKLARLPKMGAAGSVEEIKWQIQQNKLIESDIRKQLDLEERSQKLLLLGPGESGKSTILKQMSYLDCVERLAAPDYRASIDDMLRCRTKTTGVVEVQFQLKTLLFRVMDVGGQRSERRKWIQCFDGVNSIIFIASLSEYNQKLEEDNETNRMKESLNLFRWVCNHKIFMKTPIILFLNKMDLFEEKIRTVPLTVVFPEYQGSNNVDECQNKIKREYVRQNENLDRDIYCHFTCATDTKQIAFILQSTIDSIVQDNIKGAGLV